MNPLALGRARPIGSLSTWWAVPCNRTMVLAGVAAALASALATTMLRKKKKKGGEARS